jgi:ABC-2 type transport system ATP-binding protein
VNPGQIGPILTVRDVRHAFGPRQVLKGVSLDVWTGEIYALLGPNGAGKTTLARAICGRLRPQAGKVQIIGRDPWSDGEARAALGLAPQALALYPQLTVAENLQTFAALAGVKGRAAVGAAVRHAMAVTHTDERAGSLVRLLSGGFQRRVNIAAAILAGPKLLVLDEPTVGVDLPAREAVSEVLRSLRAQGVAILLVTHDLEQAGALADRVGFLKAGEKVLEGAPEALVAEAFGARMEVEVDVGEPGEGGAALLSAEGLEPGVTPGAWTCLAADGYVFAGRLAERLQAAGVQVLEVRVRRPSLQQLFAQVAEPTPRQAA